MVKYHFNRLKPIVIQKSRQHDQPTDIGSSLEQTQEMARGARVLTSTFSFFDLIFVSKGRKEGEGGRGEGEGGQGAGHQGTLPLLLPRVKKTKFEKCVTLGEKK